MNRYKTFTDLEAWQQGMILVKNIYAITKTFPKTEQYGLTSQLRRASTSILANLAEGYSRSTAADKAHKYTIARGECAEVHALILICIETGYISYEQHEELIKPILQTGRLLSGLVHSFSSKN